MSSGMIETWGRLDRRDRLAVTRWFRDDVLSKLPKRHPSIAHGLGRSYRDVETLEDGVHKNTEELDLVILICGNLIVGCDDRDLSKGWAI